MCRLTFRGLRVIQYDKDAENWGAVLTANVRIRRMNSNLVFAKRDEASCLFPAVALEDLLQGRRQVVVSEFAEDTMKEVEGQLMCFQKRLLRGVGEGAVERRSARHTSHRESRRLVACLFALARSPLRIDMSYSNDYSNRAG